MNACPGKVQAAACGLGIAYVPESFARTFLDSKFLVTILEDWSPPIPGLALYYLGNNHMPSTLRAFVDTLKGTDLDSARW